MYNISDMTSEDIIVRKWIDNEVGLFSFTGKFLAFRYWKVKVSTLLGKLQGLS